jgi:hypothetical protein
MSPKASNFDEFSEQLTQSKMDWLHIAQGRDQRRTVVNVNKVLKLRISWSDEGLTEYLKTRRKLLHVVSQFSRSLLEVASTPTLNAVKLSVSVRFSDKPTIILLNSSSRQSIALQNQCFVCFVQLWIEFVNTNQTYFSPHTETFLLEKNT